MVLVILAIAGIVAGFASKLDLPPKPEIAFQFMAYGCFSIALTLLIYEGGAQCPVAYVPSKPITAG